jgi:hypothetical protein
MPVVKEKGIGQSWNSLPDFVNRRGAGPEKNGEIKYTDQVWNFVARAIPARGNDLEPILSSRYQDRAFARCAGRTRSSQNLMWGRGIAHIVIHKWPGSARFQRAHTRDIRTH